MATVFHGPYRLARRSHRDPLWRRLSDRVGRTLLKQGPGVYVLTDDPSNEDVAAAQATYLGGHEYVVDAAEAQSLTAAGYGAYLTTVP